MGRSEVAAVMDHAHERERFPRGEHPEEQREGGERADAVDPAATRRLLVAVVVGAVGAELPPLEGWCALLSRFRLSRLLISFIG